MTTSVALLFGSLYLSASSAKEAVPTPRSVVSIMKDQAVLIFGLGVVTITNLPRMPFQRAEGRTFGIAMIPFPIYVATPVYFLLRAWTVRARYLGYAGAILMCTLYWVPYLRMDGTEWEWLPWDRPLFAYVQALSLVAMSAAWVLYRPQVSPD